MKGRLLTVILAVLLALAGTAGVLAYVHGANNRALAGQKPVTVLIASQPVPAGTNAGSALHEGLLTSKELPASSVPDDAVQSLSDGLGALVLSSQLPPGQLLLRPMLVTAAAATSQGTLAIPRGMVAVTVPLCMPEAVAGYVQAGSEVAVFDTYGAKNLSVQENCGGTGQSHQSQYSGAVRTRIVLPKVLVLSVGAAGANASRSTGLLSQNATTGTASSGSGGVLVTFAVTQADAERLILLTETGVTYLALLTPSSGTKFDAAVPPPLFQP
ncbi:MAG TPA: Flp pilus assembly protein CpaB [Streptosporangiaceae bacterium]